MEAIRIPEDILPLAKRYRNTVNLLAVQQDKDAEAFRCSFQDILRACAAEEQTRAVLYLFEAFYRGAESGRLEMITDLEEIPISESDFESLVGRIFYNLRYEFVEWF